MMKEETLQGTGDVSIFVRSWRPEGPARSAMVCVHGFKAHGGTWEWAAGELVKRGVAVYALDLRGHGRSGGEPLHVEKFGDYVSDVAQLVELVHQREPDVPVFLVGHSAGGVISTGYVLQARNGVAGFICESFAQKVPAPDAVLALVRGLSHIAPNLGVFDLKAEDFSRDPVFVERMRHDPLISRDRYPTHTIAELSRADNRHAEAFPQVKLPVLILHGTADKVTVPAGSQRFYDSAGSTDKTLRLYDGYVHDLLNDVGKERVLADIFEWMEMRRPRAVG
jgi:alpha-beta hydrolase superfamily lysophospholipase